MVSLTGKRLPENYNQNNPISLFTPKNPVDLCLEIRLSLFSLHTIDKRETEMACIKPQPKKGDK